LTLSALSLVFAGLAVSSEPAVASVGSDQTDIARIEQQIAAQGAKAQSLVSHYNEVQAQVYALDEHIAQDRAVVAADRRVESTATAAMRRVAVSAYVSGRGTDATLAMFSGSWNATRMLEQSKYLGVANTKLDNQVNTLHVDEVATQEAQSGLQSEQAQATKTLQQLASAQNAATAAIASEQTQLSHVRGNLRTLVAAANEQQRADQLAAERALAAAAPSQPSQLPLPPPVVTTTTPAAPSPTQPPSPSPTPTPPPSGGYANPLRAIVALSSNRIDQGVDYSGFGPIYAIGDGVVLNTVSGGWPGGTFIAYRLTDGPASGLVVYAAEDIQPSVQVGATVTSGTVLGQMYAGPTGIETGWADPAALPNTMARTYGQFDGSNSSAFGYNFSQFLQTLGAPGGIVNGTPAGDLPASWPRW
jgi:murein DD-endopeptidase MepM/ murein hydrolase activator NlpD